MEYKRRNAIVKHLAPLNTKSIYHDRLSVSVAQYSTVNQHVVVIDIVDQATRPGMCRVYSASGTICLMDPGRNIGELKDADMQRYPEGDPARSARLSIAMAGACGLVVPDDGASQIEDSHVQ